VCRAGGLRGGDWRWVPATRCASAEMDGQGCLVLIEPPWFGCMPHVCIVCVCVAVWPFAGRLLPGLGSDRTLFHLYYQAPVINYISFIFFLVQYTVHYKKKKTIISVCLRRGHPHAARCSTHCPMEWTVTTHEPLAIDRPLRPRREPQPQNQCIKQSISVNLLKTGPTMLKCVTACQHTQAPDVCELPRR
jgi:hypothetical protein